MKKIFMILVLLTSIVFAKVDYSEMSTEELLAMMGYVTSQNQKVLSKELQFRYPNMSDKEKKIYKQNLQKLKAKNGK